MSSSDRLDSWKEIAAHLSRAVRTLQRWEKSEGLPIHRDAPDQPGIVYAYSSELDCWWSQRRLNLEKRERPQPSSKVAASGAVMRRPLWV